MKHLCVATFCDQLIPQQLLVKIGWGGIQEEDPFGFELGPPPPPPPIQNWIW
jgi:hypothetical protein